MTMQRIKFLVNLEDDFERYLRPGQSVFMTVPSDATIADLQKTIMNAVKLPDYPLISLDANLPSTGHVYATPDVALASEVPQRNDGLRVVYAYPRRYNQVIPLKDVFCKREDTIRALYNQILWWGRSPFIVHTLILSKCSVCLTGRLRCAALRVVENPRCWIFYPTI
ncbi:uncharacterized protein EV420DRAFT_1064370 [Desarmillaria tabescens]|uniref:Uncharacterized protein n=1 Tax=Armillaria tabescens TaxID=1929756 RepID=A0AA39JKL8_ARMTA|nr:uncharacterized protein EV420DRAFT_1064370 [Desarmillaria tabescens]KAK0443064.1 hypothetical protein EV420DRAFT_1064370 [Desarmillaria tabescens]